MGNGNQKAVQISKYGRRMSSERQRYLYLYISPFHNDLETSIHEALDALNTLLAIWKPPLPARLPQTGYVVGTRSMCLLQAKS